MRFAQPEDLASRVLLSSSQALEENMKFSREFNDEQQAEAREQTLRAGGYQAWRKHSADGHWQVIWLVPTGTSAAQPV